MRVQLHAYAKACIYWYMKKKTALRPKRADFSRTLLLLHDWFGRCITRLLQRLWIPSKTAHR